MFNPMQLAVTRTQPPPSCASVYPAVFIGGASTSVILSPSVVGGLIGITLCKTATLLPYLEFPQGTSIHCLPRQQYLEVVPVQVY